MSGSRHNPRGWHLRGKTARVRAQDNRVKDLDRLYVAKVENPKT
jgi:hypothetical protein